MESVRHNRGFTLVELITVTIVLGVIAVIAIPRFTDDTVFKLQTTRDDIVAGLFYAQQTAIARGNTSTIRFISNGTSIDVQENGISLSGSGQIYPLILQNSVVLDATTLVYDKLGRTTGDILTLSKGSESVNINIETSGYAY